MTLWMVNEFYFILFYFLEQIIFASEQKGLALTRWCNVGPSGVGEDFPISDDSNANLIGTALKSNYHRHGDFLKSGDEK